MEKAIKHLKWRFGQERITISKKDLDALNEIIKTHNETEKYALKSQKLFIKLFIDSFLKHTSITGKSSKETLNEMERLLAIPVADYYQKMKDEVPYLRFQTVVEKEGITPLYQMKNGRIHVNNSDEVIAANRKKINRNQQLLLRTLNKKYTDKELKDFLDNHLFSLILKYSKFD